MDPNGNPAVAIKACRFISELLRGTFVGDFVVRRENSFAAETKIPQLWRKGAGRFSILDKIPMAA